jgi:hypothetical protein
MVQTYALCKKMNTNLVPIIWSIGYLFVLPGKQNTYMKKTIGTVAFLSMMTLGSGFAFAQTTTNSTTGGGTTVSADTSVTPGVPSTGAGGDMATNLTVLGISGVIVVGSAAFLLSKPKKLTQ